MKFKVTVTRTESASVEVEADNAEEAEREAYVKAIEEDYDGQEWETLSIDTTIEGRENDEEEEDEEDDQFPALTELAKLGARYRGCDPV